ncbi:MAG: ABC transporter substrate-binding protein [Xanthobacteraceae bacterium]
MRPIKWLAYAAAIAFSAAPALAQDKVALTIGQRGFWDTAVAHLGIEAGIFKKHNLELDITYTAGSGETLQPVVAGRVDIGIAAGTLGTMSQFLRGAPVRIIGAEATGAADYWYVKASSPIKSLKDTDGKTLGFSTVGSSTNSIVLAFIKEFNLKAKPLSTGNPAATLTAVMTDQVDVGWAAPPLGLQQIEEGQIRVIARATDATIVRGQTIRVIAANAQSLEKRKPVIERFMRAYREAIDYMYSDNPKVFSDYAKFANISEARAKRVREEFFPKALMQTTEIKGLDTLMAEGVGFKQIPAPLTKEQLSELLQIPK